MAINQEIISTSWEGQQKSYIEAGLKTLLQRMLEVLESPLAANSVGSNQLTQELRDVINSIGSKVPNTRTVNNKELSSNIAIGPDDIMVGNQTLADKLDDMDDAIGQGGDTSGLASRITALETSLNRLTGTEDTTQIIDTFNEVIDFLANVNNNETLLGKLQQLQTQINSKANDNAVVKSISVNGGTPQTPQNGNVNIQVQTGSTISPASAAPSMDGTANVGSSAKYAREDHVHPKDTSKQDVLTFDNAPTAGSNNPVKSGGIKTAIDNLLTNLRIVNGEWYIGDTATGVSAQGPAGNVNITDASQLVTILVNDLTTGGAGNILSAEMGKVLKIAVQTLIDSMGEYCFPNGRPTLSWEGAKCNVAQNLTDVTSNFSPSRVDKNGSLEITLTPVDNLHVFLAGDVTVEMGGTDITSTAWNENTGKITFADVTDDVVITAKSSTYVQSGLVLMLDGKNQGATANQWMNLCNYNKPLVLSGGYTKNTDNVQFNGTDGTGLIDGLNVDLPYLQSTAEAVFSQSVKGNIQVLAINGYDKNTILGITKNAVNEELSHCCTIKDGSSVPSGAKSGGLTGLYNVNEVHHLVNYGNVYRLDDQDVPLMTGTPVCPYIGVAGSTHDMTGDFSVSGYTSRANTFFAPFNGKIFAIRMYNRVLKDAEMTQNHKVDKKRFNIA